MYIEPDFPLFEIDEQPDPEPHGGSAEKHEDMPDEVHSLFLSGKGDHADGVEKPAAKDQDKHPKIILYHSRNEKKTAPADQKIKSKVKCPETRRSEDPDKRDPGNDQAPLDTEHDQSFCIAPVNQAQRRKRAADKKIDRAIIETPPELFHEKPVFPGMIKAAHGKKKDHADAVKARCQNFEGGVGL